MAVVSSILSIEVDELGRPLNIKAFDSGDTISSGILEEGVKTTLSSVNTSSIYWNETYYKVLDRSSIWEAGGEASIPSDVSSRWENSYNYLNSGGSATLAGVSSTVYINSGTWGAGGGAIPNDVSSKWQNAYDYLNGGASANIGSTSTTVLNSSGNWTTAYTAVNTSGNTVWNRVFNAVSATSGTWNNAYNYLNGGASANIGSTSTTVLNSSGNWTTAYTAVNTSGNTVWNRVFNAVSSTSGTWNNAYNYLNGGASANIASVSASVFNTSSNWNTAYTHSQVINANPHATDISSLNGVSLDIPGLQAGQFLKYKPGLGWTNDSIAITNIATPGAGTITNTSALTFSANQGLSVTAVGTTLTFAISGNVSGATSSTNAFSSTNALSATSALNAQQAPNGFNVTGTLSATTASATTYLNLPSSLATWNASALQGKTLNAASPSINEILRYNGTQWVNSSETQYSLNSELGTGWTINAASGINFTKTATNTFRITANYTSGIWNASALQTSPLSATLVPTTGQSLVYNGTVWTASSINTVNNAVSSTNAFSSTNALSATSALNASRAPAGFNVTGTVAGASATFSGTLSSTNLLTLSGDISATRLTDYSERVATFTITTSAITLNLENAQVFSGTLNSNISSVTISNPDPRTNTAQGFTVLFMADGTARTITWPGAVKWASGTGPTMTSTNGKVDILSFFSPNNGTTWYGFVGGQNF